MSKIFTPENLNTYAGKTLTQGLANQITSAVNSYIETQTKRCWGESRVVTGERYNWGRSLWLRHMDVTSIQALNLGYPQMTGTQLQPANTYFFDSWGRVTLFWQLMGGVPTSSVFYRDYVSVDYTYGTETVPDDLREAALGIALQMYNWADQGGQQIVSTSVGSYRLEFAGAVRGANEGPTPWKDVAEAHFRTVMSHAMQRVG